MEVTHLNELIKLEESYWWHIGKRKLFLRLLKTYCHVSGTVLEGGIGSGYTLSTLNQLGYKAVGLDIMPEAAAHCHEKFALPVLVCNLEKALPLKSAAFDVVILLDALEHFSNPVEVLKEANRVLKNDGKLIISVPAYNWLKSSWDDALGHKKRYTVKELLTEANEAGFSKKWLSHWNLFSLPIAIITRVLGKFSNNNDKEASFPRVPEIVNRLLLFCAAVERLYLNLFPLFAGLSIIGVFEKNEEK